MNTILHSKCRILIEAFKSGKLGQTVMPEDVHPVFRNQEERLSYFTLPMALNYQRDSYKLWEAALKTFYDPETNFVFNIKDVLQRPEEEVRSALVKHKIALQPNKHIATWIKISRAVSDNFDSFTDLFKKCDYDFLKLKDAIQVTHKKDFPYLSGPKIFNYWSFIMSAYGKVKLLNREYLDIAPDTHVTQCSVVLGVITEEESQILPKDTISQRWRNLLSGSGIDPIDMHSPLWFWSRNGFLFKFPK